jgi:hypothetical protein
MDRKLGTVHDSFVIDIGAEKIWFCMQGNRVSRRSLR